MQRQYPIRIYSTYKNQIPKMSFVQHDTEVNRIYFEFYDDFDKPMADIATATAAVKRPDGNSYTYGSDAFEIEDNFVTFILPPSAVYTAGECQASVSLYNSDMGRLTVQTFKYTVTPELVGDTPIDETNEYPILVQLLGEVQDLKSSYVGAIRESSEPEVVQARGTFTFLDDRLNFLDSSLKDIVTVNIREFGAKCDGVTDDSTAVQAAIDYVFGLGGGNALIPRGTTIINQEVILKSNVNLVGVGYASKIKTTAGSSGNGLNLLRATEQANITVKSLYIENLGYGKSGTWTPTGTFDGVGACILAVGCENFVVDSCYTLKGGAYGTTGEGVANIYFSCCKNSKIINNYASLCDNGIVVDSWYNQYTGKSNFINDGVVVSGNTVTNGAGRGICIENVSPTQQKGSIVVIGNTINKMAYGGIQGNNIFNCVIANNAIDGDKTDRSYGNGNYNTFYGIEFSSGAKQAVISGNTIKNIKYNGIRCFEASDLTISQNNVKDCEDFAIFVKNVNDAMNNVSVNNNNINTINDGISIQNDVNALTMQDNRCSDNIVRYNTVGGSKGIVFQNQAYGKCDCNTIHPIVSYGGCIGIKMDNPIKCSVNGNSIFNATIGINLYADTNSVSNDNLIESCTNAYHLDTCQRTFINSKIRGGTTAFDILNGKTTTSTKCRAFYCDFDGVTNVKNGTGIIVWLTSSVIPAGTWEGGDRVRNDAPTVGGVSEWVYVSGSFRPVGTTS